MNEIGQMQNIKINGYCSIERVVERFIISDVIQKKERFSLVKKEIFGEYFEGFKVDEKTKILIVGTTYHDTENGRPENQQFALDQIPKTYTIDQDEWQLIFIINRQYAHYTCIVFDNQEIYRINDTTSS